MRATRNIITIPGTGGYLKVYRFLGGEDPVDLGKAYEGSLLEIGEWRIRHFYKLAKVTHSGSNGAINRVIVAQDFEFVLELPWNAREQADPGRRLNEWWGFIQQILIGSRETNYNVSVLFALGDALNYPNLIGRPGTEFRAALHAPRVLLEEAEYVNNAQGEADYNSIIRVNVKGQGNCLLRGLRGSEIQFNEITDPLLEVPPNPVE